MNQTQVVLFYSIFELVRLLIAGEQVTKTKTLCFDTVTYYFSNPNVSRSHTLSYTYKNTYLQQVNISLNCDIFHDSPGMIEVESVKLLLPANEDEYCIDSNTTNHLKCSSDSQCTCCLLPKRTCHKTLQLEYDSCNNRQSCELEIQSEYLHECIGRTFDCGTKRCHSRWVQVTYNCRSCLKKDSERDSSQKPGD